MLTASAAPGFVASPGPLRDAYHAENAARVQTGRAETGEQPRQQVIGSAAEDLERVGLIFNRKLRFVMDHDLNEVIVKVVDKETDKVIRVLPPEELQRMHRALEETIGFLFDTQV